MSTPTLADVVSTIESVYPPRWAADGDPVGLVVGDPAADVRRILFAVDPVQVVVEQAIRSHADLVVVHHPLLYKSVSSVAADEPKGRVIHDLITHGIALYVAHTNADTPALGVSESMAFALGLDDVRADDPRPCGAARQDRHLRAARQGAAADRRDGQCRRRPDRRVRPLRLPGRRRGDVPPGAAVQPGDRAARQGRGRRRDPDRDGAPAVAARRRDRCTAAGTSLRGAGLRRLRAGHLGERPGDGPDRPAA